MLDLLSSRLSTCQSPSGKTHKNEWNKFSRQCLDRSKFPASLAGHCLQNKQDLFNVWLENDGDWGKVQLQYERTLKSTKEFKKGRKGMKARDIISAYGEEKLVCQSSIHVFLIS